MKLKNYSRYLLIALCVMAGNLFATPVTFNYFTPTTSIGALSVTKKIASEHNGSICSGEYMTIFASGHTSIVKPYIIVEGIDFLNDQDFQAHVDLYNNNVSSASNSLLFNLYNNGYDVIILDFDYSGDYIQNNAFLLVELIKHINAIKANTGNNMIVQGYSMGGLVARYALTWMEANLIEHQTRLFITHDTPHKGANFPIGLQELVNDMTEHMPIAWVGFQTILASFEKSYPGATQMLVYHWSHTHGGTVSGAGSKALPANKKINFFQELYNLNPSDNGYPSKPLRIAVSNGNYSGQLQAGITPGDAMLSFNYTRTVGTKHYKWPSPLCGSLFDFNGCDINWGDDYYRGTARYGFTGYTATENFEFYTSGIADFGNLGTRTYYPLSGSGSQNFSTENYDYDRAPGSYLPSFFLTIVEDAIKTGLTSDVYINPNPPCFIATTSALDLNMPINSTFDPNNSRCFTNFDYIFANSSANLHHFELAPLAKNFIMTHVLVNEVPNRPIAYQGYDLVIPNNTIVYSGQSYNKTVQHNITNAGNFTLKSNSSSGLIAGNSITFSPGFKAETGSNFSAKIKSASSMCSGGIAYLPNYVLDYVVGGPPVENGPLPEENTTEDFSNYVAYNCSNMEEMPNYSSERTYFICDVDTTINIDSTLAQNISIYPNPTSGPLTIQLSDQIPLNDLSIKVFDPYNNLVAEFLTVTSRTVNLDFSNGYTGLYNVQFNFFSGAYIYSRKVMKM